MRKREGRKGRKEFRRSGRRLKEELQKTKRVVIGRGREGERETQDSMGKGKITE